MIISNNYIITYRKKNKTISKQIKRIDIKEIKQKNIINICKSQGYYYFHSSQY